MNKLAWNEQEVKLPDGTIKIKVWKISTCKSCGKEYTFKNEVDDIDNLDYRAMKLGYCQVECIW